MHEIPCFVTYFSHCTSQQVLSNKNTADMPTEDKMALLSLSNMLIPWAVARGEPRNRLPTEQIDKRSTELVVQGRKDGEWITGNTAWKREKYA